MRIIALANLQVQVTVTIDKSTTIQIIALANPQIHGVMLYYETITSASKDGHRISVPTYFRSFEHRPVDRPIAKLIIKVVAY